MMIAPPTLVPMIDGLEKKKLLTRGTDAKRQAQKYALNN